MEKDILRLPKNEITEIVVRIDDFGGRVGLTIREFTKSDRYTGFTKSGTRISADQFDKFKEAINKIDMSEFASASSSEGASDGEKETESFDKPKGKKPQITPYQQKLANDDISDEDLL